MNFTAYTAYFVSDIHLAIPPNGRNQIFLSFLQTLGKNRQRPCTHLFLLGDIFDLWIADHPFFIHHHQSLINEIKRLLSENIEVHFFEGNHDLYLQKLWGDQWGVKVHTQATYINLGPFCLRLEHGDQMDPTDKGYFFLRWLLRTPLVKCLAHHLPSFWVTQLGQLASRQSRNYTSYHKTQDNSVAHQKMSLHAELTFAKKPFDLLIAGHQHAFLDRTLSHYRVINLGSWMQEPGYLVAHFNNEKWEQAQNNRYHHVNELFHWVSLPT